MVGDQNNDKKKTKNTVVVFIWQNTGHLKTRKRLKWGIQEVARKTKFLTNSRKFRGIFVVINKGVFDNRDGGILVAINVTVKVRNRTDVMVVSSIDVRLLQVEKIDDS